MLNIGINGFGRIGRSIFRSNISHKLFNIVAINDINPDVENLNYQLNYDTLYDQLPHKYRVDGDYISCDSHRVKVFNESTIDQVEWEAMGVDFVIDSSGIHQNVLSAKLVVEEQKVKKVIVTHSPDEVDFTMVLGANEEIFDPERHKVISSSICDATAIAPVLKIIKHEFGIKSGQLTTLHPWLGHQNLMDGPASSWSVPGEIYHHYALGRSAVGNMIPKPTSALEASSKVVTGISSEIIGSYSMRTPTHIVACADITLLLKDKTTHRDVIKAFKNFSENQKWKIINNNFLPLVSSDFKGSEYSANVDHRFTSLVQGNMLKLLLWYDNEWGYSNKVCEQIKYIEHQMNS